VFPNGLPDEYSLVSTFRLRRTTKKDRWYLWQIADQNGSPQIFFVFKFEFQIAIVIDGNKRVVELAVRGLLKNTLYYTFKSRDLHTLFDRQWHKLSFSFQSKIVSLYMDCKLIERRLIDEKDAIDSAGRMLITTRVEDGRPIDIELQKLTVYCDPLMPELEACCEIPNTLSDTISFEEIKRFIREEVLRVFTGDTKINDKMTSLAHQLKRLALPQNDSTLLCRKEIASLLFYPKQAASIDRDTFYALGCTGLEELIGIENAFEQFEETLFSQASKSLERSVQSKEVNKQLDEQISLFLTLLSPYFMLKPAHKCLEWLINRFHIHLYNQDSLIACALPYHETKVFVRVIQLLTLSDPTSKWNWLEPSQAYSGHTGSNSQLRVLFSFYASTIVPALDASEKITDTVIAKLLPYIQKGLKSSHEDYKAATYMIICQLAIKVVMEGTLVNNLVVQISKSLKKLPVLLKEGIGCLIVLLQNQKTDRVDTKSCFLLCSVPDLVSTLQSISESYDSTSLLSYLLPNIIRFVISGEETIPQDDSSEDVTFSDILDSILHNLTLENDLDHLIAKYSKALDSVLEGYLKDIDGKKEQELFHHFISLSMSTGKYKEGFDQSFLKEAVLSRLEDETPEVVMTALNALEMYVEHLGPQTTVSSLLSLFGRVDLARKGQWLPVFKEAVRILDSDELLKENEDSRNQAAVELLPYLIITSPHMESAEQQFSSYLSKTKLLGEHPLVKGWSKALEDVFSKYNSISVVGAASITMITTFAKNLSLMKESSKLKMLDDLIQLSEKQSGLQGRAAFYVFMYIIVQGIQALNGNDHLERASKVFGLIELHLRKLFASEDFLECPMSVMPHSSGSSFPPGEILHDYLVKIKIGEHVEQESCILLTSLLGFFVSTLKSPKSFFKGMIWLNPEKNDPESCSYMRLLIGIFDVVISGASQGEGAFAFRNLMKLLLKAIGALFEEDLVCQKPKSHQKKLATALNELLKCISSPDCPSYVARALLKLLNEVNSEAILSALLPALERLLLNSSQQLLKDEVTVLQLILGKYNKHSSPLLIKNDKSLELFIKAMNATAKVYQGFPKFQTVALEQITKEFFASLPEERIQQRLLGVMFDLLVDCKDPQCVQTVNSVFKAITVDAELIANELYVLEKPKTTTVQQTRRQKMQQQRCSEHCSPEEEDLEYTKQLVLSCLTNICQKLSPEGGRVDKGDGREIKVKLEGGNLGANDTALPENSGNIENVVNNIINVFVDALPHVPEHRRLPILSHLLSTVGPERFLWVLLLLLFKQHVTKTVSSATNEEKDAALERDVEFWISLCSDFQVQEQLISVIKILQYLPSLPDDKEEGNGKTRNTKKKSDLGETVTMLFNTEEYSGKELRHYKFLTVSFVAKLLASSSFIGKVADIGESLQDTLQRLEQSLLEEILRYINSVAASVEKNSDKPTAKFWRALLNKSYDVLDKVNSLLPNNAFIPVIKGLMGNQLPSVRRKAMDLLNNKLQHRVQWQDEQVIHLLELSEDLLLIAQRKQHMEEEQAINRQTALYSLKLLCRCFGAEHQQHFVPVLRSVVDLVMSREEEKNVLGSALLCIAEVTSVVKALAIPELPRLMPAVIKSLKDRKELLSNEIYLLSMVTTLQKVSEALPHFISPYLMDIILLSHIGPLMEIFQDHIKYMQSEQLKSSQSELTNFFLKALDFRSDHSELFDWCKTEGAPKDRLLTFCRLADRIADKLKGLFLLFAGHLVKPFSNLLNQTNLSKTDEPFFDSEDNTEKSCLMLHYILDCLHKIFLYDTRKFVSKERAEFLMMPLIDQLENMLGGEESFQTRVTEHLIPCVAQFSVAVGDDAQWKQLNYQILLKTRHSLPKIRFAALIMLMELAGKLRENYMVLLPETIPFLAELMEDECEEVEQQCHKVIQQLEVILGEPLQSYF
ncbi:HEAT1 protein, partial [Polypterus senegalus]